ncbi:DNA helicase [Sarracenia purpurea var. burkii]
MFNYLRSQLARILRATKNVIQLSVEGEEMMDVMVSRWNTVAHTFVTNWGQVSPTLEDVDMLMRLPTLGAADPSLWHLSAKHTRVDSMRQGSMDAVGRLSVFTREGKTETQCFEIVSRTRFPIRFNTDMGIYVVPSQLICGMAFLERDGIDIGLFELTTILSMGKPITLTPLFLGALYKRLDLLKVERVLFGSRRGNDRSARWSGTSICDPLTSIINLCRDLNVVPIDGVARTPLRAWDADHRREGDGVSCGYAIQMTAPKVNIHFIYSSYRDKGAAEGVLATETHLRLQNVKDRPASARWALSPYVTEGVGRATSDGVVANGENAGRTRSEVPARKHTLKPGLSSRPPKAECCEGGADALLRVVDDTDDDHPSLFPMANEANDGDDRNHVDSFDDADDVEPNDRDHVLSRDDADDGDTGDVKQQNCRDYHQRNSKVVENQLHNNKTWPNMFEIHENKVPSNTQQPPTPRQQTPNSKEQTHVVSKEQNPKQTQIAYREQASSQTESKPMSRTASKRAEHSTHVAIEANLDPDANSQTPVVGGSRTVKDKSLASSDP